MHKLYYIEANRDIPHGVVTSTARKGTKWNEQVKIGDVVELAITGTEESLGRAVVVLTEQTDFREVLNNARHNHVAFNQDGSAIDAPVSVVRRKLYDALTEAYGDITHEDKFTILHILPLNEEPVSSLRAGTGQSLTDWLGEAADAGVSAVEIIEVNQIDGVATVEKAIRYEF